MLEVWRDIDGFEGYYQISNLGNVRSLDRYVNNNGGKAFRRGQLIKTFINGSGYVQCKISKDDIQHQPFVHKLVAKSFIPNPNNLLEVNHKDHNKNNNYVSNLEWCTRSENMIKSHEFYGTAIEDRFCGCGEKIYHKSETCLKCLGASNRKAERPLKEELLELIKIKSFVQIGKDYGVSDNAVRKWCKSYGLPYLKKDIDKYKR